MSDTSYFASIVKVLEPPKKKFFNNYNNISATEFRVLYPQVRTNIIINLVCWGKLADDVLNYYKTGDYIIIEGYLSLISKKKLKNLAE
jgi:single-stranded DNA-binding protein